MLAYFMVLKMWNNILENIKNKLSAIFVEIKENINNKYLHNDSSGFRLSNFKNRIE